VAIVVLRSFIIERGSFEEFERLSREGIWPYMEARGCKVLGLYQNLHGGPSDEAVLFTAYDSLAHWEATRLNVPPPAATGEEVHRLARVAQEAGRARAKLTRSSSSRVLKLATNWVNLRVHPG